jgi:hypothetical protein
MNGCMSLAPAWKDPPPRGAPQAGPRLGGSLPVPGLPPPSHGQVSSVGSKRSRNNKIEVETHGWRGRLKAQADTWTGSCRDSSLDSIASPQDHPPHKFMPTVSRVLCGLYRWAVTVIIRRSSCGHPTLWTISPPPQQLVADVPWRGSGLSPSH